MLFTVNINSLQFVVFKESSIVAQFHVRRSFFL
jgi:hypothetical protein